MGHRAISTAVYRRIGRIIVTSTAGTILFFSGLFFDLTPWAQAIISATTSLFYKEDARKSALTLLYTEADLGIHADHAFPIPYRAHANVLRALAADHPKAVFLDFSFLEPVGVRAESFAWLTSAICDMVHEGTRVFVVDTRRLVDESVSGPVPKFDCATRVGALADEEEFGNGVLSYPRCSVRRGEVDGSSKESEGPPAWSAAYAMYRTGQADPRNGPDAPCDPASDEDMAIVWPAIEPDEATRLLCESEDSQSRGFWTRTTGSFVALYRRGPTELKRRCPYPRTMTVGTLLTSTERDTIAAEVSGKVVFYGAKLDFTGDTIRSPVFTDMPGVYYHAIAYDNLVNFHGHPKESPSIGVLLSMIALLTLGAAHLVWEVEPQARPARAHDGDRLLAYAKRVRQFAYVVLVGILVVVYGAFTQVNAPEYLLGACFLLYIWMRWVTDRKMALYAGACYLFSLALYFVWDVSFAKFLSMICFLEIVDLLSTHLAGAASRVGYRNARERGAMSWTARAVCWFLCLFKADQE